MILAQQNSVPARQVQPNHEPKLSLLELPGGRKPCLLETQTQAFQRFTVNHCTPYTYTLKNATFPVTHCTPCTYTINSMELQLTICTSYTYNVATAICAITLRQSPPLTNPSAPFQNAPNPSPASPRAHRPSKPTLNFTPSLLATTTRRTSTPVLNQNLQQPPNGSEPHLSKPPVHLEFW